LKRNTRPNTAKRQRHAARDGKRIFGGLLDDGGPKKLWLWTPSEIALHDAAIDAGGELRDHALERAAGVSRNSIRDALQRRASIAWLPAYLRKGADPPPDVRSVTRGEMDRLCRLFNHPGILRRLRATTSAYDEWFARGIFPADEPIAWLLYLYGWSVPAGWLVITESMERLRSERTTEAICRAAKIAESQPYRWRRRADTSAAFEGLCRSARNISGSSEAEPPKADRLGLRTMTAMRRFANAARLAECCRRAGLAVNSYYAMLARVKDPASKTALEDFLSGAERDRTGFRFAKTFGVIGPKLFRPPPLMREFVGETRRLASPEDCGISRLMKLPCFGLLVAEFALPRSHRGTRHAMEWFQTAAGIGESRVASAIAPPSDRDSAHIEARTFDAASEEWPPRSGWAFRPGEAACDGKSRPLRGKVWELLKRLAVARGPVLRDDLRRELWRDNPSITDDNIRMHVGKARSFAEKLTNGKWKIATVGITGRTAWRLDRPA
jgi:hypothetical protein